jgi:hypothetical protein
MNESFFKKFYFPEVTLLKGIAKCCMQRLNWTADFRIQNNRNSLDFFWQSHAKRPKKYLEPKYWFSQDPKIKEISQFY